MFHALTDPRDLFFRVNVPARTYILVTGTKNLVVTVPTGGQSCDALPVRTMNQYKSGDDYGCY
jgi:hypothetical protein